MNIIALSILHSTNHLVLDVISVGNHMLGTWFLGVGQTGAGVWVEELRVTPYPPTLKSKKRENVFARCVCADSKKHVLTEKELA